MLVNQLEPPFLDLVQSISSFCGLKFVNFIVFYSFSISVFDVLDLYHKHKWYKCLCITIRQKVCHLPAGGEDLSNRTSMVWFITWITFLGVTRSTKPKLRRIDPDQMKLKWTLTALKHAGEYIFETFRKTTQNGFFASFTQAYVIQTLVVLKSSYWVWRPISVVILYSLMHMIWFSVVNYVMAVVLTVRWSLTQKFTLSRSYAYLLFMSGIWTWKKVLLYLFPVCKRLS